MRTLYVRRGRVTMRPRACAVLHVIPLLRELILETVRAGQLRTKSRLDRAMERLVIFQIEKASVVPTFITLPREPHALSVAEAVLNDPAQPHTLAALCARVGVGVRTIQRAFRKDVGTDFASWRRQLRLTKAVELLIKGGSVKEVSFRVGYRQSSAFVELFRRTFGMTPKAWISTLQKAGA